MKLHEVPQSSSYISVSYRLPSSKPVAWLVCGPRVWLRILRFPLGPVRARERVDDGLLEGHRPPSIPRLLEGGFTQPRTRSRQGALVKVRIRFIIIVDGRP